MPNKNIAFDALSRRRIDDNGFLHVGLCHISKETVNEYWGNEIPGWEAAGLEPQKVYRGYRAGVELEKAAPTFNGLPLLSEHIRDGAENPRKEYRVGNLGTDAAFNAPYLDVSMVIQDAEAIREIEQGSKRELSASYSYVPLFQSGAFNGQPYDFVMTEIRGNHVAIVPEGRAGHDVVVSDSQTVKGNKMDLLEKLRELLALFDGGKPTDTPPPPVDDEEEVDNANPETPEGGETPAKIEPKAEDTEPPVEEKDVEKKEEQQIQAADVNAIAARVRADLAAQYKAAEDVRPLIGKIDAMAYDSAASIYRKALELKGTKTQVTDPVALREMVKLAKDASRPVEPVIATDSKQDDGYFKNVSRIRRA